MEALLRKARIAVTPRSWMLKRALSNGAVVYGRNGPGQGGRGIYLQGDGLEPELEHLESLLPKDGVLIDIGANTGIFTLKAAKHFGNAGTVIAVEPSLEMLNMLTYSIQANGFNNVRVRNLCIGDRTGEQKLWLNFNKPNSFSLSKRSDEANSMSVLVVTLDDLCEWEGLTRLDYIKMDVVGAEEKALAGAHGAMRRFKPLIQVAVHTGFTPPKLPDYSMFQYVGVQKENLLYIPDSDTRIDRITGLGWRKL